MSAVCSSQVVDLDVPDSGHPLPQRRPIEHLTSLHTDVLRFVLRPDSLESTMSKATEAMDKIARTCLCALGRAANFHINTFLPLLDDMPVAKLAASPLDVVRFKASAGQRSEAQKDQGLLTLIFSPQCRALQVQSSQGTWQSCVLQARHILILAGQTLEHASSGAYTAGVRKVDGASLGNENLLVS
ncbi:hypothetical protein COCSUDRAFT_56912 [Coccomyxa subellipsoidea C-169]|uniref:Uncharacterized protein n=1 Tax=Coccomyxa subellipsoidea (strain C-169) TaxID=574566 RepID=I0YRH0_COCSC|nr:hypothetical protein COCSUDRAFT_56912 [Coccomyxa subellipsoidea C-169]EIE20989.1 hypothetical protein COCSUDRAFT_56912 [Coccomyxa subellipsoidea C-169]|eukprot:XP_005645533.1 hypothetical protein COCSUDRAFT_56912 [Coccomyxa subellipsoidea C-169]